MKECNKRNQKKFRKFSNYNLQQLYFGTLILALHCDCGDNIKHGFLSKHLPHSKQQHCGGKKSWCNDKRKLYL